MDPFSMVVAIVAISVGAGVINTYLKSRVRDSKQDKRLEAMHAEVAALRQRVVTLEKLVTDPDKQLRDAFDKLAS